MSSFFKHTVKKKVKAKRRKPRKSVVVEKKQRERVTFKRRKKKPIFEEITDASWGESEPPISFHKADKGFDELSNLQWGKQRKPKKSTTVKKKPIFGKITGTSWAKSKPPVSSHKANKGFNELSNQQWGLQTESMNIDTSAMSLDASAMEGMEVDSMANEMSKPPQTPLQFNNKKKKKRTVYRQKNKTPARNLPKRRHATPQTPQSIVKPNRVTFVPVRPKPGGVKRKKMKYFKKPEPIAFEEALPGPATIAPDFDFSQKKLPKYVKPPKYKHFKTAKPGPATIAPNFDFTLPKSGKVNIPPKLYDKAKHTNAELRRMAKAEGLKNYSKLKKADLKKLLSNYWNTKDSSPLAKRLERGTVKQLKAKCAQLNIRNYKHLNKANLILLLVARSNARHLKRSRMNVNTMSAEELRVEINRQLPKLNIEQLRKFFETEVIKL